MKLLTGKTAVITGGTSGIGLATAKRFIDEGADVFITGRREAEMTTALAELGPHATGVRRDVSISSDLDVLYAAVTAHGRGLDVVFANAGVTGFARLEDVRKHHLDELFQINVHGVVFTVQKALPLLNPGASIIVNSSVAATRGRAGLGTYAATKAAIRSYTRTWASELSDRGIRVNAIAPGTTATAGIDSLAVQSDPGASQEEFRAQRAAAIPLRRIAQPDEIASAVLFLASDLSSFITGASLPIDGGFNQV